GRDRQAPENSRPGIILSAVGAPTAESGAREANDREAGTPPSSEPLRGPSRGASPAPKGAGSGKRTQERPVAEWHDATEEYLEAILELEEEGTLPIRARLVERLGVSAPSVSETVNRLVDHGYAELLEDRSLRLTEKGRDVAVAIVRRHRLAERLLVDVIGLEWEKVHREADRWEHVISADVEEKLVELLGDPAECPHGNPIPGSRRRVEHRADVQLDRADPGPVTIARVSEKIELDDAALQLLATARLIPGSKAVIVGRDNDGVRVATGSGEQLVPPHVAQRMWVRS